MSESRATLLPAIIFAREETAALRVAALTVLDRLIVAVHRAGAGPITVVTPSPLPALNRTRALRIPFETCPTPPKIDGTVLLADTNLLAQASDIRRCLETRSRLLANDGTALELGVLESFSGREEVVSSASPTIGASGVARPIHDASSAKDAESALWSSLGSACDGVIDRIFNRPCGRPLSKLLIHTPITPNMVSISSIFIGVLSVFFFANGTHGAIVTGAILFQLSAIIDCVDGDIARMVFKESPLGKWIDLAGDQIVHISVFAGIAFGVGKAFSTHGPLWLGISAVVGAVLSFAVILRGMRAAGAPGNLLKRLIDAAANRDFSVLVLALALFQRLDLFLWMAAIGSHVFWMTVLALQLAAAPRQSVESRP